MMMSDSHSQKLQALRTTTGSALRSRRPQLASAKPYPSSRRRWKMPGSPEMKAGAQDAAGSAQESSSSSSGPGFPNLILPMKEGKGAGGKKPSVCADHFELDTIKDDQLRINILTGFSFDFHSADKIAICVHPNETFVYKPKEGHALYICEVGLLKQQAESLPTEKKIQLHVTASCGTEGHKRILVATLSKKHAKSRLGMVLPTEIKLSHTADRKNVYINAFELKYRPRVDGERFPIYNYHLNANKELWVAEVPPSEEPEFRPTAEQKIYNLVKVFSEKIPIEGAQKLEDIQLFVEYKGNRKSLGTLSDEIPSLECEFKFDDTFRLAHSSSTSLVFFSGYTISTSFELEDLSSDPSP